MGWLVFGEESLTAAALAAGEGMVRGEAERGRRDFQLGDSG